MMYTSLLALAMLSTILYCTAPHCIALQCNALLSTALQCTTLLCTALNCTALLYNHCTRGSHHYCHHNQLMVALPLYTTHSTMCMFHRYKPCKPVQCTCPLSSVYVYPSPVFMSTVQCVCPPQYSVHVHYPVCMSTPVECTCPVSSVTCNAMMGW